MIEKKYKKSIIIYIINNSETILPEYFEELESLATTANIIVDKTFIQKLYYPNPRTFIRSGKIEYIKNYINISNINTVIFYNELSPTQVKNLEIIFKCKILSRTKLILDIFSQRAKTSYARTQVELAKYQYLLPHLTHMWTHLERQKGGIGLRGPGEAEIETDRRIIRNRINILKKKLKLIDKQRSTQRNNRKNMIRVAIVGYTNVGKSTLMNVLTKSNIFAENKLFATVDTTVRKIVIYNYSFLLTDTVGFIRKLPQQLIKSFKSTLDEVREADILMHVVDISNNNFEEHIKVVDQTLFEIQAANKPKIIVFNKIDKCIFNNKIKLNNSFFEKKWEETYIAKKFYPSVFISAYTKENITLLKNILFLNAKNIKNN
ncbi:MAG: GTPase HflX [Candidatus Bostrichicola ureolyticus]|nr:MAG: GTPase HflX [Candidatus Bostrichicola ureolyticus]